MSETIPGRLSSPTPAATPPPIGNQPNLKATKYSKMSEIQNEGRAPSRRPNGTRTESAIEPRFQPALPRRHAANIPRPVPKMNARIVAKPTNPSVQGSVSPISVLTRAGKYEKETPRFPDAR